jgi:hypothetical protein
LIYDYSDGKDGIFDAVIDDYIERVIDATPIDAHEVPDHAAGSSTSERRRALTPVKTRVQGRRFARDPVILMDNGSRGWLPWQWR